MASACIEIETTRDIAHQIVRHRSFAFQEFSQRYADPTAMGDAFTTREARLQDTTNRQNSIEIENDPTIQMDAKTVELITDWQRRQHGVINQAKDTYEWAIKNGIAKEQARVRRNRKGKKSTILTGPMGIQESEEDKLESLLGKK